MKRLTISCLIVVAGLIIVACLVALVVAYGTNSLAAIGLSRCNARAFLQTSSEAFQKFDDTSKRAAATSRIALSPVVGEMQQIRRDYADLQHPDCTNTYFNYMVAGMDDEIDAYLSFMGQADDYVVGLKMNSALNNFQKASTELAILNNPTYSNIPTPSPYPLPTIRPIPTLARLPLLLTPTPPSNNPGYSRSNPIPLGKAVIWTSSDGAQIKLTLLQFYRGQEAWRRIKAANQYNTPPPSGAEYLLVKIHADFVKGGKESSTTLADSSFVVVTSDGHEYLSFKGPTIVPPDPEFIGTIYAGGSLEGWAAFTVAAGDSHPLFAYGQTILPSEMRVWLDTK